MSFRKRNVGIPSGSTRSAPEAPSPATSEQPAPTSPGVRPSPVDGRPVTSTGTPSLDGMLAGHAGLALGTSLLVQESGTTDFAGALLRFYAAEGVVQGHHVHVVGVGLHWGLELPGLAGPSEGTSSSKTGTPKDKMKIAWRYERLGEFGTGVAGLRASIKRSCPSLEPEHGHPLTHPAAPSPSRDRVDVASPASDPFPSVATSFSHAFDLTKRLSIPTPSPLRFIPMSTSTAPTTTSPFTSVISTLRTSLSQLPPSQIHRVVIPTLLSPALYPFHASQPTHVLHFLHAMRALLRQYPSTLTAMVSLPLDLYPRSSPLVRWMELLADGVLELTPFPHALDLLPAPSAGPPESKGAEEQQQPPQGMLHLHQLPVVHERGGGMVSGQAGVGDNLAFTLSRRRFVIRPFSLPPVEGDSEGGGGGERGAVGDVSTGTMKLDLEF
ncbi:MAG: hypothetical protein M1838_003579 [Thelocarpon superellum]|nr:MAG: hypothetical protein M1838_003579 [Thelocarpon superellum]